MSNKRLLAFVLFLALVSLDQVRAGGLEGGQKFSKSIGNAEVTVVVRTREGGICLNPKGWVWGSNQECPQKVIATLAVKVDKKTIFVPVSAYGDLADLRSIAIKPTRNGFEVDIIGGDAGTSYDAILQFDRGSTAGLTVLRTRIVRSGEFPDDAWEETRYHFREPSEVETPIR